MSVTMCVLMADWVVIELWKENKTLCSKFVRCALAKAGHFFCLEPHYGLCAMVSELY